MSVADEVIPDDRLLNASLIMRALDELPAASVMVFDLDLRFVLVRGAALASSGLQPSELETKRAEEALPEARWRIYRPMYEAALRGEPSVLEVDSPDGLRHYMVRVSPVTDESGAILGGVAIATDTTEHMQLIEELRQAEQHYRFLAENVSDVVMLVGADDRITWVSSSSKAMLGWKSEEICGRAGVDFVHPDDLKRMQEALPHARAGEGQTQEYRIRCADGSYRWISARSTPLPEQQSGHASGVAMSRLAALRDVNESVLALQALEASRTRLRAILDSLADPHVLLDAVRDADGKVTDFTYAEANPEACKFNGLTHDELIGMHLLARHPNAETSGLFDSYVRVLQGGPPLVLNDWAYRQDLLGGAERRYDLRAVRVGDSISQVWRDVTNRFKDAQAVVEAEARYRMLAENTMDLVIAVDNEKRVTWVSSSVTDRLGYLPDEVLGSALMDRLIHEDDRSTLLEAAGHARLGLPALCRIRLRNRSDAEHWVEAAPRPLHNDVGEVVGLVIGVRDIHEVVLAERALEHELDFDALTGLAKRALALKWIDEILRTRRAPGWALLCVGVDGMTSINQAFTYAAGDEVLKTAAERLLVAAGARDRVARVAGDEFVVLLRDIESSTDAATAAERLVTAVRGPVTIGDAQIQLSVCVGIAMSEGSPAEELLRDSTTAMRQANARGRDRWGFLDEATGKHARDDLAIQFALHAALDEGAIQPWLMPIADIRTRAVVGYEALVRWLHPDGEVITPDKFLDIAERTGEILAIDRTMLTRVLDAMATLPTSKHVAVNVSAASLSSGAVEDWVRSELLRTGIDPARLHLEVTETALLRPSESISETMQALANLGISWWVDDFGTGFSSISHLRDLPISGLKLDQSFTMGVLNQGSRAAQLSHGLAGLAAAMGIRTIAEGVETVEQAAVLAEQGWELGQGWLFGKPEPLRSA